MRAIGLFAGCRSAPCSPPAEAARRRAQGLRSRLHGRWPSTAPASGSRSSAPVRSGSVCRTGSWSARARPSRRRRPAPARAAKRQARTGSARARVSISRSCRSATTIAVRPVRQVLHNDCEATALSMLLAAAGVRAGQLGCRNVYRGVARSIRSRSTAARSSAGATPSVASSGGRREAGPKAASASTSHRSGPRRSVRRSSPRPARSSVAAVRTPSSPGVRSSRGSGSPPGHI